MNKEYEKKRHAGFPEISIYAGTGMAGPDEACYDGRKLDVLEEHFLGLIRSGRLQCASYLLARKGRIFACESMGARDHVHGGDFRPDSIRWTASITKLFTTVAIFQLFEQGKVNLYEPVSQVIGEFGKEMHRKITPAHLLTHTSGIRADGGYFLEPYEQPFLRKDEPWITQALEGPLQSKPGESWAYSSLGFLVLGEIVRRVSGMRFEDYVQENILDPLGLEDTGFSVPAAKRGRLCITQEWETHWLDGLPENYDPETVPPPSAGAMFSTLGDLYRMGECLLRNGTLDGTRIVCRKSVECMSRNQLEHVPAFSWGGRFPEYRYGMGLVIDKDLFAGKGVFGHEGFGACALYIDKEQDLVSVFFSPSGSGWIAEAVDNPRAIIWSGLLPIPEGGTK